MSMYIVEYDPAISGEAHRIIQKTIEGEMSNQETTIYEINYCIEELQAYGFVESDVKYLIELAADDMHPRSYIEF